MKVLLALIAVGFIFNLAEAGEFLDKLHAMASDFRTKFKNMGSQLKDVGKALVDQAKDKAKSFASQTAQAVVGAFSNALKGFNLGEILFGKRSLDVNKLEFMENIIAETAKKLDRVFDRTCDKFGDLVDDLVEMNPSENFHSNLANIKAEHDLAVRTIIGDSLNVLIDKLRKAYYKAKAFLMGSGEKKVADPITIKRSLLTDAWSSFKRKLSDLKELVVSKYHQVSEITNNVTAALGYYGGKMIEQAKEKAVAKVHQTLGYLTDHLKKQVDSDRKVFETSRLAGMIHEIMDNNE